VKLGTTILFATFSLLGCVKEKSPDFVAHCGKDEIARLSVLAQPPIDAESYLDLASPTVISDQSQEVHDAWLTLPTGKVMYCRLVFSSDSSMGVETWTFTVSDSQEPADTETLEANGKLTSNNSAAPRIELVRSIYTADKDVRDAAIAEAETHVVANYGVNKGILRYETVLIEPDDIIVGDLSQPDAFAKEFHISFLGNVSFMATETEFSPPDINNQASWRGVLDGGNSGTIEMTIHAYYVGNPYLSIRLNAPPNYYFLFPLDGMRNIYVAAEANVAYRRSIRVD